MIANSEIAPVVLDQIEMLYVCKVTYFIWNIFYPIGTMLFYRIFPYVWALFLKTVSKNPASNAAILRLKLLAVSIWKVFALSGLAMKW